jgi:predicted secreted protein
MIDSGAMPLAFALAALLVGCTEPPPPPPAPLYLRQRVPREREAFRRVNPEASDLGTFDSLPPTAPEERSCGDVVAFTFDAEAPSPGTQRVEEILVRVWWYGGVGRGTIALSSPASELLLAQAPVTIGTDATTTGGYGMSLLRLPVGRDLPEDQLAGLYLTLDSANSAVKIATCPGQRSLLLLNPPSDAELAAADSDGDGMNDLEELRQGRDPWDRDPPPGLCLPPVGTVTPPAIPPPPELPTGGERLGLSRLEDERAVRDGVLRHAGDLLIAGSLRLEGSWLILEPDPTTGMAPTVKVDRGAELVLSGATIAPSEERRGYRVVVDPEAKLVLEDSTVLWGGSLVLDDRGYPAASGTAFQIAGDDRTVRGNRFVGNLNALRMYGEGTAVLDNRFEGNGLDIFVEGARGRVVGNSSEGSGSFLRLDCTETRPGQEGWRVEDNTVRWWIDTALVSQHSRASHLLKGNRLLDGNEAIDLEQGGPRHRLEDNELVTCRGQQDPFTTALSGHELEGNRWRRSTHEGCP